MERSTSTSTDPTARAISASLSSEKRPLAADGSVRRLSPTSLDYVLVRDGLLSVEQVAEECSLSEGDCVAALHNAYERTGRES